MARIPSFLLSLCLVAGSQTFARAQTAAYAEITSVDVQHFPQVTALVDVFNANGEFIDGLTPSNISLYEDGQTRSVGKLTPSVVPVQMVVGINPGPALGVRDASGVPRFTRI